jgi:predicted RNase H-like HicB family nuclease
MNITFESELEDDGRWLAEVSELAGVMAYGVTEMEAVGRAEALAFRVLVERVEQGAAKPKNSAASNHSICENSHYARHPGESRDPGPRED